MEQESFDLQTPTSEITALYVLSVVILNWERRGGGGGGRGAHGNNHLPMRASWS